MCVDSSIISFVMNLLMSILTTTRSNYSFRQVIANDFPLFDQNCPFSIFSCVRKMRTRRAKWMIRSTIWIMTYINAWWNLFEFEFSCLLCTFQQIVDHYVVDAFHFHYFSEEQRRQRMKNRFVWRRGWLKIHENSDQFLILSFEKTLIIDFYFEDERTGDWGTE